jgi:glutaredoxin-related protein
VCSFYLHPRDSASAASGPELNVILGLKVLNDWPTFPQLIVKGELVGGLDIVQEMDKSGELAQLVA